MSITSESISDLISTDLSLERIREIKDSLLKQKSTIEYQLDKESKKYFDDIQQSLKLLNLSQKSVNSIKGSINNVNKLSEENASSIKRYEIISQAADIFETIRSTSSIYDKIVNFQKVSERIDDMLNYELSQDYVETGCPNLLPIHYTLTQIRDFQDQMTVMAAVSSDDIQRTVKKVFTTVAGLINKFDELLEALIYDIVEIARSGQTSLVIRLFKVVNIEEREDIKILAIRNIIKKRELEAQKNSIKKLPSNHNVLDRTNDTTTNYPTDNALYQEILNGTITSRLEPRGYKNFFLNKLQQSIRDMFVEVRKTYHGETQFEVLNNLDWIFNELIIAKNSLVNLAPPHWNIFEKFYDLYYRELNTLINELVESEPETLVILDILDYDKTFQANLLADFGFTKKDVKSVIGDSQKEKLFTDYLNLLQTKMTEWINNLEKAEFEVFEDRKTPPHLDSESLYFLDGTKTCFQMFTQQVDVAAGANQAKILVGVVEKFTGLLLKRQQAWDNKIQDEVLKLLRYNKLYDENPQNVPEDAVIPGGLLEYIVAITNDQMKAADYMMGITNNCTELLNKVWIKEITKFSDNALDSFAALVKKGCGYILSIIFDDLKLPFSEIFSKNWYNGNQIKQIADTIDSYLVEIEPYMSPIAFITLIAFLVDEVFYQYMNALNGKHEFKMKQKKFSKAIQRDFEIIFKLFAKYVDEEQKREIIDIRFKFIEFFMDMCCENVETVVSRWRELLPLYPDIRIDFLEAILVCRKDIDSSTRKKIRLECERMLNSEEVKNLLKISRENGADATFISRFRFDYS